MIKFRKNEIGRVTMEIADVSDYLKKLKHKFLWI